MRKLFVQKSQQLLAAPHPDSAWGWQLEGGRAWTLQARHAAELLVSQGRIWATLDGPHAGPANDWGDLVLHAGDRLQVRAGQRVVIEVWSVHAGESASVIWRHPADAGVFSESQAALWHRLRSSAVSVPACCAVRASPCCAVRQ